MRWPVTLSGLALMTWLLLGCGQASSPSAGPGAPPDGGVIDATKLLKAINESAKSGDPAGVGLNYGVIEMGPHRLKTIIDVPVTTLIQNERATVRFGGKTLVVEFDKGRALLDDIEKAKLPAGTKEVEVRFVDGKLTMTADGQVVLPPEALK